MKGVLSLGAVVLFAGGCALAPVVPAANSSAQVARPAHSTVKVVPPPAHQLRVGEASTFAVRTDAPLEVAWQSTRPEVLEYLGAGSFYAREVGAAQACARVGHTSQCVPVQVVP